VQAQPNLRVAVEFRQKAVVQSMASLPAILVGAIAFFLGYLLGSIPFGLLLTRAAGTTDLRSIGSGNIGATNVLRTGRKDLAAATLLLDALKGVAAVLLADHLAPHVGVIAALGAFIGHVFPVWLRFRGGKGVATFLGSLFAVHWPAGLAFCAVWLSAAAIWRYSSLAALLASVAAPATLLASGRIEAGAVFSIMAALLWWKHRENIARLRAGAESRIGQKA
jgi:glycerol-3-phosphate acyltransferase PlsY